MDDVKGKVKGFMKKVNNPFTSSSSGKFKGQGRVLGSSSAGPTNPVHGRPTPQSIQPKPDPKQPSSSLPRSDPKPRSPPPRPTPEPNRREPGNFDPFDPFISSGKRAPNGTSVSNFQCPVCGDSFASEEEVSTHVESCLSDRAENAAVLTELPNRQPDMELRNELVAGVGAFLSGEPSDGSVDIVLKLLRNIIREPGNDKFRRIRMSNPKIKEALGAATGGIELLECTGFRLQQEGDAMWATLEAPSEDQISLIKEAVSLLESRKAEDSSLAVGSIPEVVPIERKKIDRQVYNAEVDASKYELCSDVLVKASGARGLVIQTVDPMDPEVDGRFPKNPLESVAAKIDLPDSFYNLSAEEVKREAELRRKKMAESQLLIPKSYKEKQAKAARKRYKATVIRIQFPDGIVLQGVFLPWEPTTALYEFVSSSLKEPSLEFELLQPPMPKRRVIPRFPSAGERAPTLDEEDLVPSALIKFKPIETDSIVFTGLCNELLEVSEPLTATTALVPP